MKRRIWDVLFLGAILLLLSAGLARTLFFPKGINYFENRYAVKMPRLSAAGWLDGSFQNETEKALADQIPGAQRLKKGYYYLSSLTERKLISAALSKSETQLHYVRLGDLRVIGDWVCYWTRRTEDCQSELDAKIQGLNTVFAAHPEVDFYMYYIEKDTDIDFENNEKSRLFSYLAERLNLPQDNMACFTVDSFDEFSSWFYQTDHHWNADGSLRGYRQVLKLLKPDAVPLEPQSELLQLGTFSGSKASGLELESFSEPFRAYRYDYAPMTITLNGSPAEDYGAQSAYRTGTAWEPISYGNYYGPDSGEAVFDTGSTDRGNLLVLGESYDNAILKLLAQHFDRLCAVDLRYYETLMGQSFHLADYLAEHDIDRVLLIGNVDYYLLDTFCPEE